MLLDDRLQDPTDRRRALEQTQQALARISELSQESSRLANWLEEEHGAGIARVRLNDLLDRAVARARVEPAVIVQHDDAGNVEVATFDANALEEALSTLVKVTTRELRRQQCSLTTRLNAPGTVDVLIGAGDRVAALAAGPDAPNAGGASLERGGIGLALVLAAVVLDAHGASRWTVDGARSTVGIRLPLAERAQQ